MASPLRFRRSNGRWDDDQIDKQLYRPLDQKFGATLTDPRYTPGNGYRARRLDMDNGDMALFAWDDQRGFWLGNTETPSTLWRTDKFAFSDVPYAITRWAERELLADLEEEVPWLAKHRYLSWFFLPVLFSKDGRHSSRQFFADHAAGFPDSTREEGLEFYEEFLKSGILEDYRYEMASKLGTSPHVDRVRMSATMSEFTVGKILSDAAYEITPEIEVTTGHSLDFRAERNGTAVLAEVTRPKPPARRSANTPTAAVRDTAQTKTSGQLSEHGGGVTLFVDCSGFRDDEWAAVAGEQPEVRHRPAVVFRARPDGSVEGYRKGRVPLNLDPALSWID